MAVTVPDAAPIADTYTPVSQFGALACAAMGPWLTLHLAWFLDAVGVMFDPVFTLANDTGADDGTEPTIGTYQPGTTTLVTSGYSPGYGALLDPTRSADLTFLGQFVGVQVPIGDTVADAEAVVLQEAGLARGTDAAVIAAVRRNLSGTKSVVLLPRTYANGTPDAGWFQVIVRPEEVVSVSALTADVNAAKLGGLMWTLVETDGWTIAELEADYVSVSAVEAAFRSVTGVETDVVGT